MDRLFWLILSQLIRRAVASLWFQASKRLRRRGR